MCVCVCVCVCVCERAGVASVVKMSAKNSATGTGTGTRGLDALQLAIVSKDVNTVKECINVWIVGASYQNWMRHAV